MKQTPNMGLNIWRVHDGYDPQELATNWAIADQHEHARSGAKLTTSSFVDQAITAAKLAPGTIPVYEAPANVDIPDATIGPTQLVNGAVTSSKLAHRPVVRLYTRSYTQSIGLTQTIIIPDIVEDTARLYSNGTLTIQTPGLYCMMGQVGATSSSLGVQPLGFVGILKQGAVFTQGEVINTKWVYGMGTGGYFCRGSFMITTRLYAGDQLQMFAIGRGGAGRSGTLQSGTMTLLNKAWEVAFLGP